MSDANLVQFVSHGETLVPDFGGPSFEEVFVYITPFFFLFCTFACTLNSILIRSFLVQTEKSFTDKGKQLLKSNLSAFSKADKTSEMGQDMEDKDRFFRQIEFPNIFEKLGGYEELQVIICYL